MNTVHALNVMGKKKRDEIKDRNALIKHSGTGKYFHSCLPYFLCKKKQTKKPHSFLQRLCEKGIVVSLGELSWCCRYI